MIITCIQVCVETFKRQHGLVGVFSFAAAGNKSSSQVKTVAMDDEMSEWTLAT